jgi:hypothetical protein
MTEELPPTNFTVLQPLKRSVVEGKGVEWRALWRRSCDGGQVEDGLAMGDRPQGVPRAHLPDRVQQPHWRERSVRWAHPALPLSSLLLPLSRSLARARARSPSPSFSPCLPLAPALSLARSRALSPALSGSLALSLSLSLSFSQSPSLGGAWVRSVRACVPHAGVAQARGRV